MMNQLFRLIVFSILEATAYYLRKGLFKKEFYNQKSVPDYFYIHVHIPGSNWHRKDQNTINTIIVRQQLLKLCPERLFKTHK